MTQAQTAAKANPLHVIIVGAGLGGLAAAIATREAGHNVTICEQAPALGEVRSFPCPEEEKTAADESA